jgi:hypothetical protein
LENDRKISAFAGFVEYAWRILHEMATILNFKFIYNKKETAVTFVLQQFLFVLKL